MTLNPQLSPAFWVTKDKLVFHEGSSINDVTTIREELINDFVTTVLFSLSTKKRDDGVSEIVIYYNMTSFMDDP